MKNKDNINVGVLYKISGVSILVWGYDSTYAHAHRLTQEDSRAWRKRRTLLQGAMFMYLGELPEPKDVIVPCHQLLLDDGIYRYWGVFNGIGGSEQTTAVKPLARNIR